MADVIYNNECAGNQLGPPLTAPTGLTSGERRAIAQGNPNAVAAIQDALRASEEVYQYRLTTGTSLAGGAMHFNDRPGPPSYHPHRRFGWQVLTAYGPFLDTYTTPPGARSVHIYR
jgi:hypothetical protein